MDCILRTGALPAQGLEVRWNRATDAAIAGSPTVQVTAQDCALLMFITVADYLEQAVASNAWKDIYQNKRPPASGPAAASPRPASIGSPSSAQPPAPTCLKTARSRPSSPAAPRS